MEASDSDGSSGIVVWTVSSTVAVQNTSRISGIKDVSLCRTALAPSGRKGSCPAVSSLSPGSCQAMGYGGCGVDVGDCTALAAAWKPRVGWIYGPRFRMDLQMKE